MLPSLSLLIMLPLLELLSATLAKKNQKLHKLILFFIIAIGLALSISLPISNEIFTIDFGFFKLKFMSDIYSYFFGILVMTLWLLTCLYSYSYSKFSILRKKLDNFYKFLSLSIFAVLGNGYAADLWTLFFFYILLIFATSPLIIQRVNKASIKVLRIYIFTHIATGILIFLPAIILLQHYFGSVEFSNQQSAALLENTRFAAFLLFLFVMGISKNCILPFHNWITRTTVAPTPISALLHSVAAVKSGSIAMIKITVYIFGFQTIQKLTSEFFTGGWIFYLCGFTAVYAAFRALKTTDVKKRFAYSTISQLSYILSSIMIATPLAIMGAVLHIISHSLCKVVLFYIAGVFSVIYGAKSTSDVARIAPHLKFWILLIAFCGASIIGAPLMPGSFSKDYMLMSEWQTHHYSAMIFLVAGSIINILYIYPIIKAGFFSKKIGTIERKKIPFTMQLAIIIGVILALLMSIFISNITNFFLIYHV